MPGKSLFFFINSILMKPSLLRHCLAIALIMSGLSLTAQHAGGEQPRLTHHLSPAEAQLRHTIGRNFVETDPPTGNVFSLGEFERNTGVLIAYPGKFGIPTTLVREMARDAVVTTLVSNLTQENKVRNIYSGAGVNLNNCQFIYAPTNFYWTRDYGPWYIAYGNDQIGIVDFPYNRPRPNDDEVPKIVASALGLEYFGMNVIQTGGNYMSTGLGAAAATTLVWEENPGQTQAQINQKMQDYLGVNSYLVVEDPNNTYIDHIDCWAKFLAPDKVLVRSVPTNHPQYDEIEAAAAYFAAQFSAYGMPYKVYRVNTPQNQPYSNSFILNDKVFVPLTNSNYDEAALEVYRAAMPGYKVYGYLGLPSEPWESTDALHCRTHEMADPGMLRIRHLAYSGNIAPVNTLSFIATVTPYSGQGVYSDSVLLYYRINPGPDTPFQVINMNRTLGNSWSASIDSPEYGSTLQYYLFAADSSGRREYHPFIGAADAHEFYIGEQLFAKINSSTLLLETTAMKDTYATVDLSLFNEGALSLNYTLLADTKLRDTISQTLSDSPGPKTYSFNTLAEKGWTTAAVSSADSLDQLLMQYNWITDTYPIEGSLWAEAPSGNRARLASGQYQGNYVLTDLQLQHEPLQGNWKFWIQDTDGDGGHQARSVMVSWIRATSTGNWLSSASTNGTIAPGENQTISITCDATGLEPGLYDGNLQLLTNDPDNPVMNIPVHFTVTVNTAVQQHLVSGLQMSLYPNPALDYVEAKIITDNALSAAWTIIDLNGRKLQQGNVFLNKGLNKITLDISTLEAGLYLLMINTPAGSQVLKLVKK
jgi:agmatine/peptidylarginine deiminase